MPRTLAPLRDRPFSGDPCIPTHPRCRPLGADQRVSQRVRAGLCVLSRPRVTFRAASNAPFQVGCSRAFPPRTHVPRAALGPGRPPAQVNVDTCAYFESFPSKSYSAWGKSSPHGAESAATVCPGGRLVWRVPPTLLPARVPCGHGEQKKSRSVLLSQQPVGLETEEKSSQDSLPACVLTGPQWLQEEEPGGASWSLGPARRSASTDPARCHRVPSVLGDRHP